MAKNGYFRIKLTPGGRFVEIFPPVDGGETVDVKELQEYLVDRNYPCDVVKLKSTIDSAKDEPKIAKLDTEKGFLEAESYKLTVAEDEMSASARFYAASEEGHALTKEEIIDDLKYRGIVFGIDEEAIDSYLNDRDYCRTYVLAKGKEVTQGTDGAIEYLFNTNPDTRPKMNEDGSVDFFNLNIINSCGAGDVLARLSPAVPGEDGTDIYGKFVLPREVFTPSFKAGGAHTEISEDGTELRSTVNGNVSLFEDTVFVKDVYEVKDVDTSTGNIDYKGDVLISGNVLGGFSVKATGTVEVKGVVEGARIEAGEDIIIGRGMNGMGKGTLIAGRNIVAKFFENASITAGGYVRSEAIINSEVSAKTDIEVNGKKGNITGGTALAGGIIEAKTLGSEMGIETRIEVGSDPTLKARVLTLEGDISRLKKAIDQINPVLVAYTQRLKRGEKLTEEQLTQMKQMSAKFKALSGA
ncbi:MAG: DUF342 domain-containing protein, partial [Lachnospiraceae bacterium]|nr:DUF342 domain-containing protein [Lachnospiraceae bacterium]